MTLRVLIVGGYGTFGGRLVRLLAGDARFALLVAGRSLERARAFCEGVAAQARLEPVRFDRDAPLDAQLATLTPDVVVDASGPFQAYGAAPYALVEACIARSIHYLDFADATAFVDGATAFDAAAKAKDVVVLSGVSSFPALSTAVLQRLGKGLSQMDVAAGIAPSPHAGIGRNVIRMIASTAGKRIAGHGFAMMVHRRVVIAPPGVVPLRPRRFSLVDAPDLVLVPQHWPSVRSVWTSAGTAPPVWQRLLGLLSWLVRLRVLPSLSFLAPLFHRVGNRLSWGAHRGGMFVTVRGITASGEHVARDWHMIAEGDDGPFIPAMATAALLRKWVEGALPALGARPCIGDVTLEEYEHLFARFRITTGVRETTPQRVPLYRRYLGSAWAGLPDAIRDMHDGDGVWRAEGRAKVERGRGPIARIAAFVFGFPKAGDDVPVSVTFTAADGRETWTRNFAGKAFSSVQYEGRGRRDGLICEAFGPFVFAMALVPDGGRLRLVQCGWSAFGIPLPMFLAPVGDTFESAEEGRFHFHVEIGFPWTGLIVRYRGWLSRQP